METRSRRVGRIILILIPLGMLAVGALLTTEKHENLTGAPHENLTGETGNKLPEGSPEKKPAVQESGREPNLIVQMPRRFRARVTDPMPTRDEITPKVIDPPIPHRASNDELIEQADMMMRNAHLASRLEQHQMIRQARHVYQSLIGSGDKRAPIHLGRTYDPVWIKKFALRIYPDREKAAYWYRWGGHPNGRD